MAIECYGADAKHGRQVKARIRKTPRAAERARVSIRYRRLASHQEMNRDGDNTNKKSD